MDPEQTAYLRRYFERASEQYAERIEPSFVQLASVLVRAVEPRITDCVLDLGTGTGAVAQRIFGKVRRIIGVDFAYGMVQAARTAAPLPVLQADIHWLPLPDKTFDLALAAFTFNSTNPPRSMGEAFRVLKPGGRLAIHEWGTEDVLEVILAETMALYATDDPPPALAVQREYSARTLPWEAFNSTQDVSDALLRTGFAEVTSRVISPPVLFRDAKEFLDYKLAWPLRIAELAAMDEETRHLCIADLTENITAYAHTDGLVWRPNVVQIIATKASN